jgi:hypothetical protein
MKQQQPQKRYLHQRQLGARYGVHVRTIKRAVADGRLPPPNFLLGKLPMWSEDLLDAHDRLMSLRAAQLIDQHQSGCSRICSDALASPCSIK